jgi:hypothetical protein
MRGAYPLASIMLPGPSPLHPCYRFSGVARPVDPAYPTNKAVLLFAPVAFLFGAMLAYFDGSGFGAILLAGLNASLLLFFTWALTRELSPDDNPAAFLAATLALAVWHRVGPQSILTLAMILMAARLVNRSTGKPAMFHDSLLAIAGFGAMAWFSSWVFGAIGALAFVLDAWLPVAGTQPRRRDHLAFALVLAIVTGIRVSVGSEPMRLPAHLPVFGAIAGLCALAVLLYPRPESDGDIDGYPLVHARVRGALAVGLLATVLLTLDPGVDPFGIAGLWACVLAVPLALPWVVARQRAARG